MVKIATAWVAAGLLLVAACGDDGDTEASGESEGSDSAFCKEFESIEGKWRGIEGANAQSDEVFADFEAIEPPEELADDWAVFMEGFAAQSVPVPDMEDEEAVAAYEQQMKEAMENIDQEEFTNAMTAVQGYLTDECGIGGSA